MNTSVQVRRLAFTLLSFMSSHSSATPTSTSIASNNQMSAPEQTTATTTTNGTSIPTTVFNHSLSPLSMYYVTTPDMTVAKAISDALVQAKLAACVNIVGGSEQPAITSVYVWDGKLNHDNEYLLIIKSRTALLQEIADSVKQLHPYDVPEIIGTPIFGGSKAYLDWVIASTKEPAEVAAAESEEKPTQAQSDQANIKPDL